MGDRDHEESTVLLSSIESGGYLNSGTVCIPVTRYWPTMTVNSLTTHSRYDALVTFPVAKGPLRLAQEEAVKGLGPVRRTSARTWLFQFDALTLPVDATNVLSSLSRTFNAEIWIRPSEQAARVLATG